MKRKKIESNEQYFIEEEEKNEEEKSESTNEYLKKYYEKNQSEIFILIGYLVVLLNTMILASKYLTCIVFLDREVVSSNIIYLVVSILLPFLLWMYMTKYDFFNYRNRKKAALALCFTNAVLTLLQPLYTLSWDIVVKAVFKIPINKAMTEDMVINLARLGLLFSLLLYSAIVIKAIRKVWKSEEVFTKLMKYRISKQIDFRENKENAYDLNIIRDLVTGLYMTIKEMDRFCHMFVLGSTGTGKTSSTLEPSIICDLNRKFENKQKRELELLEMLKKKEAYIEGPFREFHEEYVKPKKEYEKKYKEILEKYPDCGLTVMAPNNDLGNAVARLCEARGFTVNVLDPTKKVATYKSEKITGLNPFYVPLGLDEEERSIIISQKGSVFADVLIAVNEKDGKGDIYFTDISKSVTTNIAIVCMLYNNLIGKQTSILDVQECITNFAKLKPMVDVIEQRYDINIVIEETAKTSGRASIDSIFGTEAKHSIPKQNQNRNPYYQVIYFVKQELLGPGASKLFEQARGLRNLINKLLIDPRICRVLAPEEHFVDLDQALKNNEITVVNTALEYGPTVSSGFGLFFLLNMDNAVKRRPKKTRSNHFWYIDEGPQYMHPILESMFALYRQYRCAIIFAVQSVSQMNKTEMTKYLKGVVLGSGIHVVFGRTGDEEMKLYSTLGGVKDTTIMQKTISQTSILEEDPSMSTSVRSSTDKVNILEGSDVRNRDFQEALLLTTDEGNVMEARIGKTNFSLPTEYEPKKIIKINWSVFFQGGEFQDVEDVALNTMVIKENEARADFYDALKKNSQVTQKTIDEDNTISMNNQMKVKDLEAILNMSNHELVEVEDLEKEDVDMSNYEKELLKMNANYNSGIRGQINEF